MKQLVQISDKLEVDSHNNVFKFHVTKGRRNSSARSEATNKGTETIMNINLKDKRDNPQGYKGFVAKKLVPGKSHSKSLENFISI